MEKDRFRQIFDSMIDDFYLFNQDENYIWSDRVLKNFEEMEKKRKVKSEAGRLGGITS